MRRKRKREIKKVTRRRTIWEKYLYHVNTYLYPLLPFHSIFHIVYIKYTTPHHLYHFLLILFYHHHSHHLGE